jgi:hypothetical protein
MKKIITLLLIAVMCLSFVACSNGGGNTETTGGDKSETTSGNTNGNTNDTTNNNTNQDNENDEEKIEIGTVTTSDSPLFSALLKAISDNGYSYTFNEDGTCGDGLYWWIYDESETSVNIMIASETRYKKCFVLNQDKNGFAVFTHNVANYNMGAGEWVILWDLGIELPVTYVFGTHNDLSKIYGSWVDEAENGGIDEIVIREDGTCLLDAKDEAIWCISPESDDTQLIINIYYGENYGYYDEYHFSCSLNENGNTLTNDTRAENLVRAQN